MRTQFSNQQVRRSFGFLSALVFAVIATGCGGGGGSKPIEIPEAILSVEGSWLVTMSVENDECGVFPSGFEFDTQTMILQQNDAAVVLHDEDGEDFLSGTLGLDRVMRLEAKDGTKVDLTVTPSADELALTFTGTLELEGSQPSGDPCRLILRLDGNRVSLDDSFPLPAGVDSEIELGITQGDTTGEASDFDPSCADPAGSGPDVAFLFTAPESGTYVMSSVGSDPLFDTILSVLDAEGVSELACDDAPALLPSEIEISLTEGQSVIVVLDGFSADDEGEFQIEISLP